MNSGCIESIVSTIINSVVESVDTFPKTITEWKKQRTIDPPKHFYSVISDSNNSNSYRITYSSTSNAYQCECKAWECCWYNIDQQDNQKTCKHTIAIRGEKAEQDRINKNNCKWLHKPVKKKPEKNVLVLNL